MLRALAGFAFAALLSAADRPSFDLLMCMSGPRADWVEAPRQDDAGRVPGRHDRYELRRATLVDLIKTGVRAWMPTKVYGGPSWLDYDRYEVAAKIEAGEPRPETLRSDAADRCWKIDSKSP